MEPVRIGVIGCGVMGRVHAQWAVRFPGARVVAVADIDVDRARSLAAESGDARAHGDPDDLLRDEAVEAVVLALPACHRTALALRAFAAGKHVLTEKPVALSADEVRRMISARADRVAACCSSRYRFRSSARCAAALVASGSLGPLRLVRCRGVSAAGPPPPADRPPPPWRQSRTWNGGGILANWGCYDLDYLLGLTGWSLRPRIVLAGAWPIASHLAARVAPGSDAESHATALVVCDGGTVLAIERGEFTATAADHAWQIIGTKGSLRLAMTAVDGEVVIHDDTTAAAGVVSSTLWSGEQSNDDLHRGPIEDFCSAIREGRAPATSLENALVVQQITDAVYRSAETGEVVRLA